MWGEERPGFGLASVLALIFQVVVFVIVISLVLIALSPLDLTGDLARSVPAIVTVVGGIIVMIAIVIVLKYIPDIITRA